MDFYLFHSAIKPFQFEGRSEYSTYHATASETS